ncbi:hypothetical protein HNP84_000573 [Thermocatellispora tengchongensis]|uniref:DUF742 domain-containing protein n=1 Tax=Thermocatellispora tengchongensis TaxID=1073253 RepID=A0A840P4B6_9ACTN|nr:DUF742 domain-containing protein [Thermocatellispora tengchongensis]MBB5130885.1 hypothetical protein [Thermocatellispora tengchongensis]
MSGPEWLDDEAGPVVRPFALTRGRARSSADDMDVIAMVTATGERRPQGLVLGPEQERILHISRRAVSVADIASDLDLPLGVVRVLLGDLKDQGLISVRAPAAMATPRASERVLKEVINGLRAL